MMMVGYDRCIGYTCQWERKVNLYRRLALVLIGALVVLSASGKATMQVIEIFDDNHVPLDRAFERGREAGRDFSILMQELRRMLVSDDLPARSSAISWIASSESRLTVTERLSVLQACLKLDLPKSLRRDLRRLEGEERWAQTTQDQRIAIYRKAITEGDAERWEGDRTDRGWALVEAAEEGIVEFAPALQRYAAALDHQLLPGGARPSEYYLEVMRLRDGARDRVSGELQEAQRLEAMGDREFADSMEASSAFRYVVSSFASRQCDRLGSKVCESIRAIVERQKARRAADSGDASRLTSAEGRSEPWLEALEKEAAKYSPPPAGAPIAPSTPRS